MAGERIAVQVVYALPARQHVVDLEVPAGTTLRQAVERARITEIFPELDLAHCELGVFGRIRSPADGLKDGDRVEIYRPLTASPNEIRRRRARAQGNGRDRGAAEGISSRT